MQEVPYTAEELQRIQAHFEAARSALASGNDTDVLGRVGLPQGYALLARALYHDLLQRHGIGIPGEAIVMLGLTVGFALGRDFGRAENVSQITAGVLQ